MLSVMGMALVSAGCTGNRGSRETEAAGGAAAEGNLERTETGGSNPEGEAATGNNREGVKTDGNHPDKEKEADNNGKETEIQVFIAASLNTVMTELGKMYQEEHPEVKITYNADSSGTLLIQIEEGYECDIFFSAAQKQMDQLEADGLMKGGTRANVVNNQLVVVTRKDSGTKVKGLDSFKDAESIALAGGSVPVGKYTRQAIEIGRAHV